MEKKTNNGRYNCTENLRLGNTNTTTTRYELECSTVSAVAAPLVAPVVLLLLKIRSGEKSWTRKERD